jgi:CBS domain-containing protein
MFAREVMSHPVVTVRDWTTVAQAAEVLSGNGFTAAPVLDDDDRLVGIVSEIDLIRGRIQPDPRRNRWTGGPQHGPGTVGAVMTSSVESLTAGADLADVARIMVDERIRCVPIVDGYRVVGVITRRDVLRAAVTRDDRAIAQDVARQLDTFNDAGRWTVSVQAAVVDIKDSRDCADDRELARRLVAGVAGVAGVTVGHATPAPS